MLTQQIDRGGSTDCGGYSHNKSIGATVQKFAPPILKIVDGAGVFELVDLVEHDDPSRAVVLGGGQRTNRSVVLRLGLLRLWFE